MSRLRIAFLHLAPRPGDLPYNRHLIERAISTAAAHGAAWLLTPELCVCGYDFLDQLGEAWIVPPPDPWMASVCQRVADLKVTLFLSHPEHEVETGQKHNTLFVIAPDGRILGKHRKIHTLSGAERWSKRGTTALPVHVPPVGLVGMLICADAYTTSIAAAFKAQGAQMLVSAAAWGPGMHGPEGEWERCSLETGLPLLVCNRTGPDLKLDFSGAESVVVQAGQRRCTFTSADSAIGLIEWDLVTQTCVSLEPQRVEL